MGGAAPAGDRVAGVSAKAHDYAQATVKALAAAGIRVEVDVREEKLGAKIRDAELAKIPYMIVVGPRDAEAGTVSPRRKGVGDLGPQPIADLIARIQQETRERS